MTSFIVKKYNSSNETIRNYVLGADIGGTNSNFGLFSKDGEKLNLIVSLHIKSSSVKSFDKVFLDVLHYISKHYNATIRHVCIGAAGIVSEDRSQVKPTNLDFLIDMKDIQKKADLETALLINDFEAVGYGISLLPMDRLVHIRKGKQRAYSNKAIIGAGTGLGKSIMVWDEHGNEYRPLPSEGGNADFAAQTQLDIDLINFIQEYENVVGAVSWEDVLSGMGIQRIYRFLAAKNNYAETKYSKEIQKKGEHPDLIFSYWKKDKHCKDTFELFARFYGRCSKCFALDILALSGLYIAGGIAGNNVELFERPGFKKEFVDCVKQGALLKNVPLFVITDYNVSLFGAARVLMSKLV